MAGQPWEDTLDLCSRPSFILELVGLSSFPGGRLVAKRMPMWDPERNLDFFILEIHVEGRMAQQVHVLSLQG